MAGQEEEVLIAEVVGAHLAMNSSSVRLPSSPRMYAATSCACFMSLMIRYVSHLKPPARWGVKATTGRGARGRRA